MKIKQKINLDIQKTEDKIRKELRKKAIKTSFFGEISLDFDKVYVDKKTADRSSRALKDFLDKNK